MTSEWQKISEVTIPSPAMSVAVDANGIWVGGLGGVMWRKFYGDWESRVALTGVSAIAPTADGRQVIVGSSEGILYSQDHGETWLAAQLPHDCGAVMDIVLSPAFLDDHTAVAATTKRGVLRSSDGGQSWQPSGIDVRINRLLWREQVLVATSTQGIYHSHNGGRQWELSPTAADRPFSAVTVLTDGLLVAAGKDALWVSEDGQNWRKDNPLPADAAVFSLSSVAKSARALLVGMAEQGFYYSANLGETWRKVYEQPALAIAAWEDKMLAGMTDRFMVSHTGGISWVEWPTPQIHDLHHLIVLDDETLMLRGRYVTALRYENKKGWQGLTDMPRPMAAHTVAPTGEIYIATAEGLFGSANRAADWQQINSLRDITHLASRADGTLFAVMTNGNRLLISDDHWLSWEAHKLPFIHPLITLSAMPHLLLVATYDSQEQMVHVWLSGDEGKQWQETAVIKTNWPIVSAWPQPPFLTLGNVLFKQTIAGWQPRQLEGNSAPFRRLTGFGETIVGLTTEGVWGSNDKGANWGVIDVPLKGANIVDVAVTAQRLYLLHIDGQILHWPLEELF